MEINIKVYGQMIKDKDKDNLYGLMEIFIKVYKNFILKLILKALGIKIKNMVQVLI